MARFSLGKQRRYSLVVLHQFRADINALCSWQGDQRLLVAPCEFPVDVALKRRVAA